MPTTHPSNRRIWLIDIIRGFAILLMVVAHTTDIYYAGSSPILHGLASLANTITFSVLFLLSGATAYIAYLHHRHQPKNSAKRITKRLFVYLLGYFVIASFVQFVQSGITFDSLIQILTFQRLVPYTEFIPLFILLGLLKIPLHHQLQAMARKWYTTAAAIVLTGIAGWILSASSIPHWLEVMLVGRSGWYTFPLLWYLPLYLVGIYIGRKLWYHQKKSQLHEILAKLGLVSILMSILSLAITGISQSPIISRWPPNLMFVSIGLLSAVLLIYLISLTHNLLRMPWTRNLLLILGQNAFAIFFTHTLIIFTLKLINVPLIHSSILIMLLMLISIAVALYLAKIIPLNYRFNLTIYQWCECQLEHCSHAKEHRLTRTIKSYLLAMVSLPQVLSFRIGRRKVQLIHPKHFTVAAGILLFTAIPLGLSENTALIAQEIESTKGELNRTWLIKSPHQADVTTYTLKLDSSLTTGSYTPTLAVLLDDQTLLMTQTSPNQWQVSLNADNLGFGEHQLVGLVDIGTSTYQTMPSRIFVSAPVLVSWTMDWEGYDASTEYLTAIDQLATKHQIPLTQLFNPRIYTDPNFNQARADQLTNWVRNRSLLHGDEIGLHLHMFPDFVADAGLTPRQDPVWGGGFTPGYDILTTAYTRAEMSTILARAKWWFSQKGLPVPQTYRAGAWFANEDTLAALIDQGFTIDSSGRTSYTFGINQVDGEWSLSVTQPPYYPSFADQNIPGDDQRQLLEIPNNGADSFAFNGPQMIARFDQNYSGGIVTTPIQVTFLSHPHWYNESRQNSMRQVFDHVSQFSHQSDRGPVQYATLQQIAKYFR